MIICWFQSGLVEFLSLSPTTGFSALLNSAILAKCFRAKLWENSPFVSKQLEKIGEHHRLCQWESSISHEETVLTILCFRPDTVSSHGWCWSHQSPQNRANKPQRAWAGQLGIKKKRFNNYISGKICLEVFNLARLVCFCTLNVQMYLDSSLDCQQTSTIWQPNQRICQQSTQVWRYSGAGELKV